jgi:hypothetical protein
MARHTCYLVVDSTNEYMNANILACSDPAIDMDTLNADDETLSLPLQDGWSPLRETAMGMTRSKAVALVLLEKIT